MNKITRLLFLVILSALLNVNKSVASHVAGADITYQHLSGDSFLVTLRIFEDCGGSTTVGPNETVDFMSDCGQSFSVTFPQISEIEVSQLCPSQQVNSTCNNGNLPGMKQKVFQAIVELTPHCDSWNMGWGLCCRNTTVNLDPTASLDFLITAKLNNVKAPQDNSPVFNAQPIPYVCINQLVNYNFSVTEQDGDSLIYRFADPYGGSVANITNLGTNWQGGATTQQPLPGATIDSLTGIITFTPTQLGNFVLVVEVSEYNDNGILIGVVRRDIQFVVINCVNFPPDLGVGQISNLTGNATATTGYSLTLCEGQSFTFNAVFTDPDVTDSLTITSNIDVVLPGSVITTSGSNPLTATISWTATPGSAYLNTTFTIAVSDLSCPIPGIQTFTYVIDVSPSTNILPGDSVTLCSGDSVNLLAFGGTVFTWYDLAGNQVPVDSTFSCNPCANPVASPDTTTTYIVESDMASFCGNRDTIAVVIAPNYQAAIVASDTTICSQQQVQFTAQITNGGTSTFSYNWAPAALFNNATLATPIGTFNNAGTIPVYLQVTSAQGCVRYDTLAISVTSAAGFSINAYSDAACAGDTVQLHLQLNGSVTNACGITADTCTGVSTQVIVGNGVGTNSIIDAAPYGSIKKSSKLQFLYLASDIINSGFAGGKINALAFNNIGMNGAGPVFHNYTIKMKCTSATNLGSTFDTTGLQTVYLPKDFTINTGYVDHPFDNLYEWDGSSNLLVEVCFDNTGFGNSGFLSAATECSSTGYTSVVYDSSSVYNACPSMNVSGSHTNLPNVRFTYCASIPNINSFNVVWTPNTFLQNLNSFDPIAVPPGDTLYSVQVTNSVGCVATDTVNVLYTNSFNPVLANSDTSYCLTSPIDTLIAFPIGGTWSGAQISPEGIFDPATAGIDTFRVVYTVGQGTSCLDSLIVHLVVGTPLNSAINPPSQTTMCSSDPTITLTGLNPGGTWSGPGVDATTGVFDPAIAGAGVHSITYTIPDPCPSSSSINLTVTGGPVVAMQAAGPFCTTSPAVNLSYSPTQPITTWSGTGILNATSGQFSPATAGAGTHTITLTVTNSAGCSSTQTMNIVVNNVADPSISLANLNYCKNDAPVQITAVTTGGTFAGTGVTANGLFDPSTAFTGPNQIIYSFPAPCAASDTIVIVVTEIPLAPVLTQSSTICEGNILPVNVINGTSPSGGVITWYGDAGLTQTFNSGNSLNATISSASTVYAQVQLNGCTSSVSNIDVVFYPGVQASFVTDPSTPTGVSPLTVNFTHTYAGSPAFMWNFGDGSPGDSLTLDPSHVYADSGIFVAVLTITSPNGCMDTASVTVISEEQLVIPNIFTPGGGDENDEFYFKIAETSLKSFHAIIFDRWGKKVKGGEFNSVKDKWDGGNYPAGIYYYTIDAVKVNGEAFTPAKGFFQLIR